jgi:acetolactate synthase regulatory subunit
MTFVEFYLWTFEPFKKREFSRVHRILRKKGFSITFMQTCEENGALLGL